MNGHYGWSWLADVGASKPCDTATTAQVDKVMRAIAQLAASVNGMHDDAYITFRRDGERILTLPVSVIRHAAAQYSEVQP